MINKIELLETELLNEDKPLVECFKTLSEELDLGLGWHYMLDLSWAAQQLNPTKGMCVLDAGAGIGVMQWWLAKQGVNVISVDRRNRRVLPVNFRQRYKIQGWRKEDFAPNPDLYDFLPSLSPRNWYLYPKKLIMSIRQLLCNPEITSDSGTVYIYNHDLKFMTDIPDESVDAIVSISALEHNSQDESKACVAELMCKLKPGGKLIATIAAAKEKDWFHEPSKGWCYTKATLCDIFDLPLDCPSNYERYDELFEALRNCVELRDGLPSHYYLSGDNGMPWGIWKPQYYPVGVCKVKE